MATIEEANQAAQTAQEVITGQNAVLGSIDTKLDEVKAFILTLQAGQPVTQEQLDNLVAMLTGIKDSAVEGKAKAEALLQEADALDE